MFLGIEWSAEGHIQLEGDLEDVKTSGNSLMVTRRGEIRWSDFPQGQFMTQVHGQIKCHHGRPCCWSDYSSVYEPPFSCYAWHIQTV